MNVKLIKIFSVIISALILLSGCADEKVENQSESSVLSDSEESQTSEDNFNDETNSNTEKDGYISDDSAEENSTSEENTTEQINVQISNKSFTAILEKNETAEAFAEMLGEEPIVIEMSDYSGFEKVGYLGTTLPSNDEQITTQAGDIVLYNDNQIVIFYGSNSWSYTKLGHIDDLSDWEDALGDGDVTVTFSIK